MWIFLGIVSVILLAIYRKGRNAIWGGLFLGVIVGFMVAIIFNQKGFNWFIIVRSATTGTLLGFLAELLGRAGDLLRKK